MTERCLRYIEDRCMTQTFSQTASDVGCDEKTIRNIANKAVEEFKQSYKPYVPMFMGLDETTLDGKLRAIITDVAHNVPVDILPDRESITIIQWLISNKAKDTVRFLTTDMYRAYQTLAKKHLPDVPLVIDKFHVLKAGNIAVDTIRKRCAKKYESEVGKAWKRQAHLLKLREKRLNEFGRFNVEMWLENEPDLKTAYELKESLFRIYDAQTRAEAEALTDAWIASVPKHLATDGKADFKVILSYFRNWREPIMNYFNYRITNGYTESFNGSTKVMNRQGRGYSFDVLRARALWKTRNLIRSRELPPTEALQRPHELSNITQVVDAETATVTITGTLDMSVLAAEAHTQQSGECAACHKPFSLDSMLIKGHVLLCTKCHKRAI